MTPSGERFMTLLPAVRMLDVLNGEKAAPTFVLNSRCGLLFIDGARCTDVQMVEADAASVESRLVAGEIACPGCGGELPRALADAA